MEVIFGKKGLNTKEIGYLDESDLFLPVGKSFWEKPVHFLNELTNKRIEKTEFLELFSYFRNSLWWLILHTVTPSINGAINFIKLECFTNSIMKTLMQKHVRGKLLAKDDFLM